MFVKYDYRYDSKATMKSDYTPRKMLTFIK
jgi:hypothetical protein